MKRKKEEIKKLDISLIILLISILTILCIVVINIMINNHNRFISVELETISEMFCLLIGK